MPNKMIKTGFFLLAVLEAQAAGSGVLRIDLERQEVKHFADLQLEASTDKGLIILGPDIPDNAEEVMLDSETNEMNYSQLREFQRRKNAADLAQQGDVKLSQKKRQQDATTLQMLSDDIENEANVQTEETTETNN